jgi:apolipoprotein N-acyltransferase
MKKTLENKYFAVFIIFSFLVYIMSNGEWCIPIFAWIYPILFLCMIYLNPTRKVCLIISSIYATGFIVQFWRAIGMDIKICIIVAILLSFLKVSPYIYWSKSKMRFQNTIIFASIMVSIEYIIYLIYPILGGLSDAYTQYQSLYLLQLVTVTGIYGITFLMYWTAAVVIWIWNNKNQKEYIRKYIIVYGSVIGLVFVYGVVMFHFAGNSDKSIRIAGVTVLISELLNNDEDVYSTFYTNTFTDENITNARSKLSSAADELFLKTELEAQAGAKIVFWSELNGAVLKQDEDLLLQRASDLAKQEEIYLIVSLLVKTPYVDLKENKTAAFNPQGELISEYFKHGRSIGELCQKGDGILKSFDTEYGRIAPFICSDMAFLSKIQQAGRDNVDILIVPASDWKEMTLLAAKTAIVRGVENGSNIIRHTNKGMSIVSDFRGSVLAQTDYFQSDTKTFSAQVLTKGRFTLYSYIGNLFVYLCNLYLLGSFILPKMKRLIKK